MNPGQRLGGDQSKFRARRLCSENESRNCFAAFESGPILPARRGSSRAYHLNFSRLQPESEQAREQRVLSNYTSGKHRLISFVFPLSHVFEHTQCFRTTTLLPVNLEERFSINPRSILGGFFHDVRRCSCLVMFRSALATAFSSVPSVFLSSSSSAGRLPSHRHQWLPAS